VKPSSWTKANFPKVMRPTRASGGMIFKLCYNESLTASNSSFGIHVSTTNKKILGVGWIALLMYSIVVYSGLTSTGRLVSDIHEA
jgi:hypothetical protein